MNKLLPKLLLGIAIVLTSYLYIYKKEVKTAQLPSTKVSQNSNPINNEPMDRLWENKLNKIASQITVKIWSENQVIGSGTIINKQNNIYEVITNSHVLRMGNGDYQIQTLDGKIYNATLISETTIQEWDLGFVTFNSQGINYEVATLANINSTQVGDFVFAAGFPINNQSTTSENINENPTLTQLEGFDFNSGKLSLILEKSLKDGYQIGITNDIKKGMSGGPLLNQQGHLIGINGKHAYPLWESPDFYEDGSQPCTAIQEFINSNSWGIPMDKVTQFYDQIAFNAPQVYSSKTTIMTTQLWDAKKSDSSKQVMDMQNNAKKVISCQ